MTAARFEVAVGVLVWLLFRQGHGRWRRAWLERGDGAAWPR